jgi:HK97 gp10 family phage protein
MRIDIGIIGDKQLQEVWRNANDKQMLRALASGMTRIGAVVRSAARARVQKETGVLKRSIGVKSSKSKRRSAHYVVIGPRKEFLERGRRPVRYAHLVELGTKPHEQGRRKMLQPYYKPHPGAKPKPFLGPALDATRPQIRRILIEAATKALQRMKARAAA